MKKKIEKKVVSMYRTNSLPLASFLSSTDDKVKFVGVDKENTETISFNFKPASEAQKLADEYFSGQSLVDPLELFKNYRALKDLIFEAKRNISYKNRGDDENNR